MAMPQTITETRHPYATGQFRPMLINGEDRFIETKFEDRSPINTEWLLGTFQKGGVAEGQEALAVAARNEPPPGFGGPGGPGPQAPDITTFTEKRIASIAVQLAGNSKGFVPRPLSFGPPPGGGPGGGWPRAAYVTHETARPHDG